MATWHKSRIIEGVMKQLTLKHVVLLYALIIIGCGVAPQDESAKILDDVNNVQFTVKSSPIEDHNGGAGVAAPDDHNGGAGVVAEEDHNGGAGMVAPEDHNGGAGIKDPGDTYLIEFSARVEKAVDVILVQDAKFGEFSVEFKQDKEGNVTASFKVSSMDFKLVIVAGDEKFEVGEVKEEIRKEESVEKK